MKAPPSIHINFSIQLAAIAVAGATLRLWNLPSQLLLDDEWHALNFVTDRSFVDVLYQQGIGANSIPINIYSWMTLHTVGWSETVLRFPSIFSGIISLFVLPLLVRRLWGNRVALITALLIATSPILIFYSRVARPYGPVMLLAPASLLMTLIWIREGRLRDIIHAALLGSLAVWYHLYASIPVMIPLAVAASATFPTLSDKSGYQLSSIHPIRELLLSTGLIAAFIAPTVILPNLLFPWWTSVQGMGHATIDTALTVARYVAGSHMITLGAVAAMLIICGLILMVKQSMVIGFAFAAPFILFTAVMATTTQDGAHAGIQAARYGISFFPLAFITIAITISETGKFLDHRFSTRIRCYSTTLLTVAFMLPSIATSPLWRTYIPPNNFTGHSAFQYRYEQRDWSISSPVRDLYPDFRMQFSDISPCYLSSRHLEQFKGVIEYPMLMGDHFNLLYYFQHFHRLPIVAGYVSSLRLETKQLGNDGVYGDDPIDFTMSSIPVYFRKSITWRSMVDLTDTDAMRQNYHDWLVIVHFNPLHPVLKERSNKFDYLYQVGNHLGKAFGAPVYTDQQLSAWHVR